MPVDGPSVGNPAGNGNDPGENAAGDVGAPVSVGTGNATGDVGAACAVCQRMSAHHPDVGCHMMDPFHGPAQAEMMDFDRDLGWNFPRKGVNFAKIKDTFARNRV